MLAVTLPRSTDTRPMPTLLIINPNTSTSVTDQLAAQARATLPAEAVVHCVTAPFGARYISSEAAAAVAAHAAMQACADHIAAHGRPDAVLLGCFGDPGLLALRELVGVPVTGLAEASMREAAMHGPYAIVTGGAAWAPMLRRLAWSLDLLAPLTGIVTVERSGAELKADPAAAHSLLLEACQQALALEPAPRQLILGGAALTGMGDTLVPLLGVPLLDSVVCGLTHAWAIACGTQTRAMSTAHPAPAWTGSAEALRRLDPAAAG